jgi:hypothetical protein
MIASLALLYYDFIFFCLSYCYCFDDHFFVFAIEVLKENASAYELLYQLFFLVGQAVALVEMNFASVVELSEGFLRYANPSFMIILLSFELVIELLDLVHALIFRV